MSFPLNSQQGGAIFAGELERSGRVERRLQTPAALLTALSTVPTLRLGAIAYSGSVSAAEKLLQELCVSAHFLLLRRQHRLEFTLSAMRGRQNGGLQLTIPIETLCDGQLDPILGLQPWQPTCCTEWMFGEGAP